jgi:hypothetical protein
MVSAGVSAQLAPYSISFFDIVGNQVETATLDIAGYSSAHIAESDETDFHNIASMQIELLTIVYLISGPTLRDELQATIP